ncbi:MAG: hypothetical protein J6A19_00015 [Oscillospiraceae bacterium]|nr:hypothetical protein [Oscillospiraceae bacterium]
MLIFFPPNHSVNLAQDFLCKCACRISYLDNRHVIGKMSSLEEIAALVYSAACHADTFSAFPDKAGEPGVFLDG